MKISNQFACSSKTVNFGIKNVEKNNQENRNKYHEYPFKYMAYTNDFGVALRPLVGKVVSSVSWIPSISYVALASLSATKNAKNNQEKSYFLKKELFFQSTANLMFPFLIIESTKHLAEKGLNKITKNVNPIFKKSIISFVGLASLLFSVKKIDEVVQGLTDKIFLEV